MTIKTFGLFLGPLACGGVLALAGGLPGLSSEAQRACAVALWMVIWWVTEAVPIAATSLIPLATYPLLGILDTQKTAVLYADPNIFLFMGGFMIAMAMQKWQLEKRLALYVIAFVGGGTKRMLLGFMLATAFISMWVSNTATAVMILPIGLAVIRQFEAMKLEAGENANFSSALMLGIAYAASIGGTATLIGSPPNIIFAGQAKKFFPEMPEVGFLDWFLLALPLSTGFLLLTWIFLIGFVMKNMFARSSDRYGHVVHAELKALGAWKKPEILVLLIFVVTANLWIWKEQWSGFLGLKGIHDGTIAMAAVLALFMIPADLKQNEFLLDWNWAKKIPWEVLLLFGGGFALAESFKITKLDEWLGLGFQFLGGMPIFWLILIVALIATFLSELMSNTAQVMMLLPILAAASEKLGIHPYYLMLTGTFAASFAFMMPVGTPPNAVVFASGRVTIKQMAGAGFWLNLLGAFWISILIYFWMPKVLIRG